MDRAQLTNELHKALIAALGHSDFILKEETTAKEIKGWDSMSHMVIMAEIERHFGVTFTFMEMVNMTNMGSMLDCLQTKL